MEATKHIELYLKLKQTVLEQMLGMGIRYVDEHDIEEVRTWREADAASICRAMYETLKEKSCDGSSLTVFDLIKASACPWCMKYSTVTYEHGQYSIHPCCSVCNYGVRHGICFPSTDSWWIRLKATVDLIESREQSVHVPAEAVLGMLEILNLEGE